MSSLTGKPLKLVDKSTIERKKIRQEIGKQELLNCENKNREEKEQYKYFKRQAKEEALLHMAEERISIERKGFIINRKPK